MHVFHTKFWRQKVSKPKQSFVIFGAKISYEKRVRKMMMKLTLGVNFTNILQIAFLVKTVLFSFYVRTVWVCNFTSTGEKVTQKNVGKIDKRKERFEMSV